jgi:hypothetical protein
MANSGINWINVAFDWCVIFLYEIANLLGITYEEINVCLFVIIIPLVLIISIALNLILLWKGKSQPNSLEMEV